MAATATSEAERVEEIHRILHSLVEESRRLERSGESPLLEANSLAIRYWRSELEERIRTGTRRGARSGQR
jgi:hypothetical protein